MVYIMVVQVDGSCRGNGTPAATGAAAAVFKGKHGETTSSWTKQLPTYPAPTNQRAEITAIILGLEVALQKYREEGARADCHLTVESDSKYAVGCMTTWTGKWVHNGWINAAGREVANQDLLLDALDAEEKIREVGAVTYEWFPWSENHEADALCREVLAGLEDESSDEGDYCQWCGREY